jgi:pimeloyl-ACP methyl ester carboxylesterase
MRPTGILTLLLAALLALAIPVRAQESKTVAEPTGTWSGKLEVAPQVSLRLVLKVSKDADGKLHATLASPDQGEQTHDVETFTVSGETVRFTIPKIGGSFEGTRKADGTEIAGTWKQGAGSFPLVLKPGEPAELAGPEVPKELEGLWVGKLKIMLVIELRIVLRVEKAGPEGRLKAYLDSPDQNAKGIPVSTISLEKERVQFTAAAIGGTFDGTLNEAKDEAAGSWSQAGRKWPLTLKKTTRLEESRRPQHPKPPFPYRAEEVSYENKDGGVTLAGTLTLPQGDGPFPAVLLITGSGPQDRDETIFEHKPFLVLADYLTRRGIAVLRVDDRGVGKSTGSPNEATSEDFAGDVLAGVAFLKARKEIDPRRIGLMGHSEGGLIAPMVASRSDDVAFLVLLAGTGVPGSEILERQSELILRAGGASDAKIAQNRSYIRRLNEIAATTDADKIAEALKPLGQELRALLAAEGEKADDDKGLSDYQVKTLVDRMNSSWMRYFLKFDPRPTLAKVRCPVLALNGEKDLQVPPSQNLPEIEKALKAGGNTDVTIVELPGLNHLFQTCTTGSPLEYGKIEETFAPAALERIGAWIAEQTGTK